MALAQDLQVYKAMKQLLTFIVKERTTFPKSYRAVGQDLVTQALRCLTLIQQANMSKATRARYLFDLTAEYGTLGTLLEVCVELRLFGKAATDRAAILTTNVGRQITGWRESSTKPEP
ncbi:four helix bundle protein [Alistipes putredinis]|uniref:four helix bundle protein n=1 Tax=Alistipes putredinis TaxID=28117 RepID=UPI003AB2C8B7